jgi:hypothetical protein
MREIILCSSPKTSRQSDEGRPHPHSGATRGRVGGPHRPQPGASDRSQVRRGQRPPRRPRRLGIQFDRPVTARATLEAHLPSFWCPEACLRKRLQLLVELGLLWVLTPQPFPSRAVEEEGTCSQRQHRRR